MIDTIEAGAGSYPEAPEDKTKCYYFVINTANKIKGYIYAESEEEAEKLLNKGKYDDLEDNTIVQVEEIEEIKEVDD